MSLLASIKLSYHEIVNNERLFISKKCHLTEQFNLAAFTLHHSILNFQFFTSFGKFGASLYAMMTKTVAEPFKTFFIRKTKRPKLKK